MADKKMTVLTGSDGAPLAYVLPRITDYFETRHLVPLSQTITDATKPEAEADLFAGGVLAHTARLTPVQMIAAAISMVEDLYGGMASSHRGEIPLPNGLDLYLRATAGALLHEIGERGHRLHYVIDNQFPTGALGPAALYPLWFKAAGFTYVSPFEAGLMLMEADGIELRAFGEFWPRYEGEARAIACDLYDRAESDNHHIVVIDDEPGEALLTRALSNLPRPGVIHLFRNEPPHIKAVRISAPPTIQAELDGLFAN